MLFYKRDRKMRTLQEEITKDGGFITIIVAEKMVELEFKANI